MTLLILVLAFLIKFVFGIKDPPDYFNGLDETAIDEFDAFEKNIQETDGKIIGGYSTNVINFPHQLALRLHGEFICGASIISINWALTAAHCISLRNDPPPAAFSFRAGSSNLSKGGTIHKVIKYFLHPKWNKPTFDFDFCLMGVGVPFKFGVNVSPITLSSSTPPAGLKVTVSGWGFITPVGTRSEVLNAVDLTILPPKKCNLAYPGGITPRMFCATYPGKDSCQGDSGGALIDISNNIQVGIVSWGDSCAKPGYPGVYSNIVSARPWIFFITAI